MGTSPILRRGLVTQHGNEHHVDGLLGVVGHDRVVDHRALLEHRVGDRAVEHRQNLRDRRDGAASVDRLAVALAKLPEEVAQRQGRGHLAGLHQPLPAVAAGLLERPLVAARTVAADEGVETLLHIGKRGLPEVDRRHLRDLGGRGPLHAPGISGDERHDRIPELLGRHPPQRRPGEAEGLGRRRVVEHRPPLVGRGRHHHPDELPQVEVEPDHEGGEVLEEFGITGWIFLAEVVDGLDDPHAHHLLPHPVGDRAGELPIGPGHHPGRELLPAIGVSDARRHLPPEQLPLDLLERLRIVVLIVVGQPQGRIDEADRGGIGLNELDQPAGLLTLRLAGLLDERSHDRRGNRPEILARLAGPGADAQPRLRAGRERGEFVELVLRPLIEWMVVALGAADLGTEQHADGVVDIGQRHAVVTELEADRRVLPEPAVGRQHLPHPLIVGLVGADRVLHVGQVGLEHQVSLGPLREPQNIGPVVVEVADIIGTRQQTLDHRISLGGRCIGEKGGRLVVGRDPAGEFQVNPPDELGVVERRGGFDPELPPPGFEQGIDGGGL